MSLRLPLLVTGGQLATVTDGTPGEIAQSASVLLSTRIGEREANPEYGSRDDLFDVFGAVEVDQAALNLWEPRAAGVVTITLTSAGGGVSA